MTFLVGVPIIGLAVFAVVRQVDVRLALLLAALALGCLAGRPDVILAQFLATLSNEQYVIPICTAMGFAHVLRQTGCDRHLVHLLVRPMRHVRPLLVPGAVLVGVLVNVPVVSQTSSAVTVGAVLVPLLRAARVSALTTGAALLLGCSIGGELLNPGAPELQTVSRNLGTRPDESVRHVLPLLLLHLAVAVPVFWWRSGRADAAAAADPETTVAVAEAFRVNLLKALVPLVPLALLVLASPPFEVVHVPRAWLVGEKEGADVKAGTRLVGAAMLLGVVVAGLAARRDAAHTARAFFEGAGYAFTHVISLIVAAACFGSGVALIGLAGGIAWLAGTLPGALVPLAGVMPLSFAAVSGSGMAATEALFSFFAAPAQALGFEPLRVGALVSLGAAAGRTLSPVAAVTLMCASLTGTSPLALARRVAVPLLLGIAVLIGAVAFNLLP